MKNWNDSVRFALINVFAAGLVASGCGAVGDTEGFDGQAAAEGEQAALEDIELGEIEAAFSADSCAEAERDERFYDSIDHLSPRSYDTCHKGYVVELHNIDHYYTDAGTGGGSAGYVGITWGDTAPTESECPNTELSVYVYKKVSGAWQLQGGKRKRTGRWVDDPGGPFDIPGTYGCLDLGHSISGLTEEADYRFAVTARTAGVTRKVRFKTHAAVHLK